mgnify:CR=1 FL=1
MHLTLVGTYTTHVTVSLDPGIRSIDSSTKKGESKLLIGTRGNEIFEIAIKGNRENYSRNEFGTILHNASGNLSVFVSNVTLFCVCCAVQYVELQ